MTITAVGAGWQTGGTGISTLAVTPTGAGDLMAFAVNSENTPSPATAVSGGGVTTWHRGTSYLDTSVNAYLDVWWGILTAAGASTVTVTGLPGTTEFTVLWAQEFNEGNAGWLWSLVAAGLPGGSSGPSLGSGLPVSWPVLTAAGASDYLYVGNGLSVFGTLNAGSSPGYTYPFTGFSSNRPVYNPAFTGTGGPTSTQTNTGAYDTVGILIGSAPPAGSAPVVQAAGDSDRSSMRRHLIW